MNSVILTQELLMSYLEYDKNTGLFKWLVNRSPKVRAGDIAGTDRDGYISIHLNYKTYQAHRLAWLYCYGEMPDQYLDHINMDKKDNRIINLRIATPSQNKMNTPKMANNKSGHKGVHWCKVKKRWIAQCKVGEKYKYLGSSKFIEVAANLYEKATAKYHGKFKPIA